MPSLSYQVLLSVLDVLVRAAERCEASGVALLQHNHRWEFAQDQMILNALLKSPLQFCPDLGWIHRGGVGVIATLERIESRIGAVCFKDFGGPR